MTRDRRRNDRRTGERNERRHGLDRRASRRIALDLWVEQERGKEVCFRHVGDLSTGGVRLDHGLSHPTGTRVRLRFHLPDDHRVIDAAAEVVAASTAQDRHQTSLRFVDLPREDRLRINAFIDALTEPARR